MLGGLRKDALQCRQHLLQDRNRVAIHWTGHVDSGGFGVGVDSEKCTAPGWFRLASSELHSDLFGACTTLYPVGKNVNGRRPPTLATAPPLPRQFDGDADAAQ